MLGSETRKSLEELRAIREKMQMQIDIRENSAGDIRVVVGMANCGIAAGARRIGVCRLEPIAEVYVPGEEKVTYVKLTPEKVPRIVAEHLVNHNPVTEYTIGAAE